MELDKSNTVVTDIGVNIDTDVAITETDEILVTAASVIVKCDPPLQWLTEE